MFQHKGDILRLTCGLALAALHPCERAQGQRLTGQQTAEFESSSSYAQSTDFALVRRSAPHVESPSRFYGGVDYLLWQLKGAPLSVPLVSTGPIATTHHGYLLNSDATILYGSPFGPAKGGNDTQNFPLFSGGRVTLGYWMDQAQRVAIEASAFALERRTAGYAARCDANGQPVTNIPIYNTVPYAPAGRSVSGLNPEEGLPACLPNDPARADGNAGTFSGGVTITNSLQVWGADSAVVMPFYRSSSAELSALVGFRYLNLSEKFNLLYYNTGLTGIYAGLSGTAQDAFETQNQFFGTSLGMRGRHAYGPWNVELTGRVALGVSHEVININGGFYSRNYTAPFASGPEGVFAQPANEGRYSSNDFAVVPEAQIKLGYALTPWLRATVGYDVLYYSSVVRPTDQINRNSTKGQTFQQGGTVVSTSSPARLFQTSDFWMHGFSVGLVGALPGSGTRQDAGLVAISPPAPAINWSGWYLGGSGGGMWGKYAGNLTGSSVPGYTNPGGTPDVLKFSTIAGGSIVGGGQIGFNWQVKEWVVGLEADLYGASVNKTERGPGSPVFAQNIAVTFDNAWQGSLRARIGFAFDRWLAYAAGGPAWSIVSVTGLYGPGGFYDPYTGITTTTAAASGSDRRILFGGTLGAGVEYALTDNVSLGAEYRYSQFFKQDFSLRAIPFPAAAASAVTARITEPTNQITARLNYRFDRQ